MKIRSIFLTFFCFKRIFKFSCERFHDFLIQINNVVQLEEFNRGQENKDINAINLNAEIADLRDQVSFFLNLTLNFDQIVEYFQNNYYFLQILCFFSSLTSNGTMRTCSNTRIVSSSGAKARAPWMTRWLKKNMEFTTFCFVFYSFWILMVIFIIKYRNKLLLNYKKIVVELFTRWWRKNCTHPARRKNLRSASELSKRRSMFFMRSRKSPRLLSAPFVSIKRTWLWIRTARMRWKFFACSRRSKCTQFLFNFNCKKFEIKLCLILSFQSLPVVQLFE